MTKLNAPNAFPERYKELGDYFLEANALKHI